VQALRGALTRPAEGDRAVVARRWVRTNRAALGLTAGDVDELSLDERSVDQGTGITHLRFRQAAGGIPAFDGGLRVNLDRGGRILNVTSTAVSGLGDGRTAPRLDAQAALRALGAPRPVPIVDGPAGVRRTTRFAGGDFARLVRFGARGRLAWHLTYRASSAAHYDAVVDATTGAILFRQNLTRFDAGALVYRSHPTATAPTAVDLEDQGWLPAGANVLSGPYALAYSDLNGNDQVSAPEQIVRTALDDFQYPFTAYGGPTCANPDARCSWAPPSNFSANREQNGVQAFYLVNRFRDHLAQDPDIGFDGFSGLDAVRVETNDPEFINNASMSTPPEGSPPRLQLHRFTGDGFRTVNAGDSAAIVWHEYTHGLSSRLVTYDDGSAALSSPQAGAMGEGWSDWYALDLLARDGLQPDTAATGQMDLGAYVDHVPHTLRTEGLDCPVGVVSAGCPAGGYTLGDFGKVAGGPDVHADGEIWGQTLWDLRVALGSDLAQRLITAGMRMSPPEPSFLDMRNAIVAAEAGLPGDHRAAVWEVFRKRGMGYFAHVRDAGDVTAAEDFSAPPAPGAPRGVTTGTVTSADTGLPLGDVTVGFAGLETDTLFPEKLVARTASNGSYALEAPAGQYGELTFEGAAGYDRVAVPAFVVAAGTTRGQDVALRRDWAASAGGADMLFGARFDNTGAPFGCGLAQLVDQRQESGWSAWNPASPDPANPRLGAPQAVVRLPATINVTAFGLDPTNTCGDPVGSSTAGYRIEVSGDGVNYAEAHQGTFSAADRNRLNLVPASLTGVRYVRLTLLSPLMPSSDFIDFSELEVFGGPPNRLPSGSLAASRLRISAGETVAFAASFTDSDSRITGYGWDFDGDGATDRVTGEPSTSYTYPTAGTFAATVAAQDFRGGAGTASRAITVAGLPKPSIRLPKRGSKGKLTFTVNCTQRCTMVSRLQVGRKVVRTVRRTFNGRRSVRMTLPQKVRRSGRRRGYVQAKLTVTVRYADGRSRTSRRTVRIRV